MPPGILLPTADDHKIDAVSHEHLEQSVEV
jgi:hypothetical protein